jgi:hypothetical protein
VPFIEHTSKSLPSAKTDTRQRFFEMNKKGKKNKIRRYRAAVALPLGLDPPPRGWIRCAAARGDGSARHGAGFACAAAAGAEPHRAPLEEPALPPVGPDPATPPLLLVAPAGRAGHEVREGER